MMDDKQYIDTVAVLADEVFQQRKLIAAKDAEIARLEHELSKEERQSYEWFKRSEWFEIELCKAKAELERIREDYVRQGVDLPF